MDSSEYPLLPELWVIIARMLTDDVDAQSLAWTCKTEWKRRDHKTRKPPAFIPRERDFAQWGKTRVEIFFDAIEHPLIMRPEVGMAVGVVSKYSYIVQWVGYVLTTDVEDTPLVYLTHAARFYWVRGDEKFQFVGLMYLRPITDVTPSLARLHREVIEVRDRRREKRMTETNAL